MKRTILPLIPLVALASIAAGAAVSAKPGAYAFRVEADGRQPVGFVATADGGELYVPGSEMAPAARACGRTPATIRASDGVRAITVQTAEAAQAVRVTQVDREGRPLGRTALGRLMTLRRDGDRFLAQAAATRAAAVTAAHPCR